MKKKIILTMVSAIIAVMAIFAFSSCSDNGQGKKFSIVTSVFSEYDWVMNVLGDRKDDFNVTLLLESGADLHSYQPSVKDIAAVSTCNLFIYIGGESEKWVPDVLKTAASDKTATLNLMEKLGDRVKEEEIVEGMEECEEESEEGEEEPEYDEHVWLSLSNARFCVDLIEKAISAIDPENEVIYKRNAAAYDQSLKALDDEYIAAVGSSAKKTILFGDRFPFRYLADDYGLTYYAAFVGCSAETEASFETVLFLARKVDELGLNVILKIESSDGSIAGTIKENTALRNQTILTMDSLQSSSAAEYKNGRTYLSVMRSNLGVLTEALR